MFELHPRLEADTVEVTRLALCRVLLLKDANYPWLVLVPARPEIREIHELSPKDRAILIEEMANASQHLQNLFKADKINVAALGNVVPQLHIHIIARFTTDAAWPKPVWGVVPAKEYEPSALEERLALLRKALA
jgi:diadenosine tetraphosphate (Ap4A) HIT family hydrolase